MKMMEFLCLFYRCELRKVLYIRGKAFCLVLECIKTKTQTERQNVRTVYWKSSSQDYLNNSANIAVKSVVNRADNAVT